MSARIDHEKAKRRDQAVAEARAKRAEQARVFERKTPALPGSPATDRQRAYLAKLCGLLGRELPNMSAMTVAQASKRIAGCRVALAQAKRAAACDVCGAQPGAECVKRNGNPRTYMHDQRGPQPAGGTPRKRQRSRRRSSRSST